jgi:hypothetical protein
MPGTVFAPGKGPRGWERFPKQRQGELTYRTVNEVSTGSTVVAVMPTAMVSGALAVAHVMSGVAGAPTLPSGWGWLDGPHSATNANMGLAYTTNPAAGLTFTMAGSTRHTVIIQILFDRDLSNVPTSLLDVAASFASTTVPTVSVPGITTLTDGCILLSGIGMDSSAFDTMTPPAGFSLLARNTFSPTIGKGAGLALLAQPTHGATGNADWSSNMASGLTDFAYLVAIRAAGAVAVGAVGTPPARFAPGQGPRAWTRLPRPRQGDFKGDDAPWLITGLRLWLAARKETGYTNGGSVAQPVDWSGRGNIYTQATGSRQPTWQASVIDGLPVYRGSAAASTEWNTITGDIVAATNNVTGLTLFVVGRRTGNVGVTEQFIDLRNNAAGTRFKFGYRFVASNPDRWHASGRRLDADVQVNSTSEVPVDNYWHLHTVASDWAAGTVSFWREERLDAAEVAWTSAGNTSPTNSSSSSIFSQNASEFLTGDIAEVLVYDRVLSAAERQAIWSYLLGIYPSLRPTSGTPPTQFAPGRGPRAWTRFPRPRQGEVVPAAPQGVAEIGLGGIALVGQGQAAKIAVQTGRASLALTGPGQAAKLTTETGRSASALVGSGGAAKVAPKAGNAYVALATSGAATKVAVETAVAPLVVGTVAFRTISRAQTGLATLVLAGAGVEVRRATESGLAEVALVGAGREVKIQAKTGLATVTLVGPGRASKLQANAGLAGIVLIGASTGKKVAPKTGLAGITLVGQSIDMKRQAETGLAGVVFAGAWTNVIVPRVQTGAAFVALVGGGGGKKITAESAVLATVLAGQGREVHVAVERALASLVIVGRGTEVHRAVQSGLAAAAIVGSSVEVKQVAVAGRTFFVVVGQGFAFIPQLGTPLRIRIHGRESRGAAGRESRNAYGRESYPGTSGPEPGPATGREPRTTTSGEEDGT